MPRSYDPATPAPLLIALHGRSKLSGLETETAFFHFAPTADQLGWLYVHPDGLRDPTRQHFWNATDACCDFYSAGVNDVAYIAQLIDGVSRRYSVDSRRVFVVGLSNGGFMAHRLACDLSERVAAVVSVSGATWRSPAKCQPSDKVSVLEIHGTHDKVIHYEGGALDVNGTKRARYPSARQTFALWGRANHCAGAIVRAYQRLDLVIGSPRETRVDRMRCPPGALVELWTIERGGHVPAFGDRWPEAVFAFLSKAA